MYSIWLAATELPIIHVTDACLGGNELSISVHTTVTLNLESCLKTFQFLKKNIKTLFDLP